MLCVFYVESINQPEVVFRKIALCDSALVTKFVETVCTSFGLKLKNVLEYTLQNDTMRVTSSQLENMPLFKKKKFGFQYLFAEQNECRLHIQHTLGSVQMQVLLLEHQEDASEIPTVIQSKGRLTMLAQ